MLFPNLFVLSEAIDWQNRFKNSDDFYIINDYKNLINK